jgi:hypothetical protein
MEKKNKIGDLDRLVYGLRQKDPVLKDPDELTDTIMTAIRDVPRVPGKGPRQNRLIIVQRLLAAASVCLFLVFGYEQYFVIDKVRKLEMQNAAIAQNSKYQSALLLNKVIAIAKSDPSLLINYKRLREEQGNELVLLKTAILFDVLVITEKNSIPQNLKK